MLPIPLVGRGVEPLERIEVDMIHEINFEVDTPRLNGADLDRLVDAFLANRRKYTTERTIKGYTFKVRPFLTWWNQVGPAQEWVLSADDFPAFDKYLLTLGWGWSSRNDAVKRVRQMFKWAHQIGHLAVDFSIFVPRLKGGVPPKMPLRLQDLDALLTVCWKMGNPVRNRAIIAILAGTGLRREECASLQIEDVTILDSNAGYLRPTKTKNDSPRLVAFDAATGAFIQQWLEIRNEPSGPLFLSRKGGQLSDEGVYKVVMDAAKLAGVHVEPHDLRRMFATVWSRQLRGDSYGQLLQKQLGHVNYATTAIYSLQGTEDVLAALQSRPVSPIAMLSGD